MKKPMFYIDNGITLYRLISAPFLIFLAFTGQYNVFKWLLLVSFCTDAIDGFLARKYKVTSALGAHLDSIADDCTILAGIVGIGAWYWSFLIREIAPAVILALLYVMQNAFALYRYKKLTSFHTYSAKVAAVSQAIFFISLFFATSPVYATFYVMGSLTALNLLEEIMLIFVLSDYRINVKGLYWVFRESKRKKTKPDAAGMQHHDS